MSNTEKVASAKAPLLDGPASAEKLWINPPPDIHYEDQTLPTSADGVTDATVAVRHWRPKDAALRGAFIIFHGLHSHSGRWARFAEVLAHGGYAVYAPDHILHGRSTADGLPVCDITDFDYFVQDARALIRRVSDEHKDLPLFVLGHSMGSVITIHALHDDADILQRVTGAVYSGFALLPGPASAAPMGMRCLFCLTKGCCGLCLGGCLASCGPMADGSVIDTSGLHHSKLLFDRMEEDVLHYKGAIRNRMGFEVLKAARRIVSDGMIAAVRYPFLAIHGADDLLTLPAGSETLLAGSSTADADKSLKIYPGYGHEIVNEYEQEGYTADADVLEFINSRSKSNAPSLDESKTQ